MSERTCPECGETKPIEKFWGERRQRMKVCTACRRKAARHKRYVAQRKKDAKVNARRRMQASLMAQGKLLRGSEVSAGVLEINRIVSRINYKLRQYVEKLDFGESTARTESAIEYQTRKLRYYEEIKELLMEDAKNGIDRPLEYYLTNTFLLHKHGFPCVVVDADPRLLMEPQHGNDD